jgi:hypothetical protein
MVGSCFAERVERPGRFCGHAGRAASVGFMAPKPPSSDDPKPASAEDLAAPEFEKKPGAVAGAANRSVGGK